MGLWVWRCELSRPDRFSRTFCVGVRPAVASAPPSHSDAERNCRAVGPTQFTPLHRHDNSTLGNRVWATFAFFLTPISTLWVKKQDIVVLSVTSRNVYRFLKFFHCLRLKSKFAIKSYLNIPPRLDRVATLPGEISMFKKSPCSRNKCSEIPWKT